MAPHNQMASTWTVTACGRTLHESVSSRAFTKPAVLLLEAIEKMARLGSTEAEEAYKWVTNSNPFAAQEVAERLIGAVRNKTQCTGQHEFQYLDEKHKRQGVHVEQKFAAHSDPTAVLAKMQAEVEREREVLRRAQDSVRQEAQWTMALRQVHLTLTTLMKGKAAVCVRTWRTKVLDKATKRETQKRMQVKFCCSMWTLGHMLR